MLKADNSLIFIVYQQCGIHFFSLHFHTACETRGYSYFTPLEFFYLLLFLLEFLLNHTGKVNIWL